MLISSGSKMMLETRDEEKKIVYFYILDLTDPKVPVSQIPHEEEYWTGVEDFKDDYIILHGFAKPDMPAHKGIQVYSPVEKKVLWENEDAVFLFRKGESIYIFRQMFDSREYLEYNITNGALIAEHGEDHHHIKRIMSEARDEEDFSMYGFPSQLSTDLNILDEIPSFSGEKDNIINIEFLRYNGYILVSYHEKKGELFDNYLEIFKSGKMLDKIKLNSKTPRLIAESWFMYKNMLITIEDKSDLKIYKFE